MASGAGSRTAGACLRTTGAGLRSALRSSLRRSSRSFLVPGGATYEPIYISKPARARAWPGWTDRRCGWPDGKVFRSKRGDRLKLLYWNGDGLALWYKRLEQGSYRFPPIPENGHSLEIRAADLSMILDGVDLESVKRQKRYQGPQPANTEPTVQ